MFLCCCHWWFFDSMACQHLAKNLLNNDLTWKCNEMAFQTVSITNVAMFHKINGLVSSMDECALAQ